MPRARCPKCGEVFEYPYEDRINVIIFDNYEKYHKCDDTTDASDSDKAKV